MTSPTLILLRLDVRHAADELRWAFWAAGTDLADERDAIDRIYQLYIVLIAMVEVDAPAVGVEFGALVDKRRLEFLAGERVSMMLKLHLLVVPRGIKIAQVLG